MFETQPRDELDAILRADSEFRQPYHPHPELDKRVMDTELGVEPPGANTRSRTKR